MAKAKKQDAAAAGGESNAAGASPAKEPKKRPAVAKGKASADAAPAVAAAGGAAPSAAKPAPGAKGKSPAAAAKPATAPAVPLIDTGLAAQSAASMIAHRNLLGDAAPSAGSSSAAAQPATAKPAESSSFKQLKQGLNKPAGAGLGNLFGVGGTQKKSNQPFGGGGQNFRNQTQSGFNKTGVPRRTGGG